MEATFTPGPWIVRPDEVSRSKGYGCAFLVLAKDPSEHAEPDDQYVVADFLTEANARLISAAPEMLAALKLVDENWSEGFSGPDDPVALNRFSDRTIAIWRSIRAAIAKAEEQSA